MKLQRQLFIQCKYKTGFLLTSELGKKKTFFFLMSYVQLIHLGVHKFCFNLSSPRCQVFDVIILFLCPPGRGCSGALPRGRRQSARRPVGLRWQGGGRNIWKSDACHLLI